MMTERKRLVCLVLIMTGVALVVGGIAIFLLYHAAIEQTRERLVETAQSQARLIEAIARFDAEYSTGYSGGSEAATLIQIRNAHKHYKWFGETGEFTLARREGEDIVFVLSHRHLDLADPRPIPFDSELAEPMRRALSGQSGTLVGLDYRGMLVIAAHEPVMELNLGIVAKIDMAEVRAPFAQAALASLGAALVIIVLGSLLFLRVSSPMIRRLQELFVNAQQELTERQRVEEDLRIRDQAIRSTSSGVIIADARQPDQPIVFVNDAFERLTGYSAHEVIGRNPRLLQRDDRDQEDVAKIRAAVDEGREVHAIVRNYRKNGTRFWNELTISPVYDNQGDLTHFVGIQNDITDRTRADEELKESESRLRQMAEQIRDVFWLQEAETGKAIYCTPAYETIWGRSLKALYEHPRDWMEAILPGDRQRVHDAYCRLLEGEPFEEEYRIGRPDGSVRWILDRGFPVADERGRVYRIAGTAVDITDRKELQKQVLEIAAEEDRRIGHELHDDIQQQLTGLGLLAQCLADVLKAAEEKEPGLFEKAAFSEVIEMAARVANGISESGSHVHLLSRGLVPVEVDADGLRAALTELASRISELHGIRSEFQCDGPVKLADNFVATHLYRIAQEAVNNALKHSRTDRIDISLTLFEDIITMKVLDNGIGIDDKRASGSGMGLRIMAYRADLIGATLHVGRGEKGGVLVTCAVSVGAEGGG